MKYSRELFESKSFPMFLSLDLRIKSILRFIAAAGSFVNVKSEVL
jgi:hypothetical protein